MTLLLADFCKLRVSASETRKPGKPFSRAYLSESPPVKSNLWKRLSLVISIKSLQNMLLCCKIKRHHYFVELAKQSAATEGYSWSRQVKRGGMCCYILQEEEGL